MKAVTQIVLWVLLFVPGWCQEPLRKMIPAEEKPKVFKKEFIDRQWIEYWRWYWPDEPPVPLNLTGKGLYNASAGKIGLWNYYIIDSNKLVYQEYFSNGLLDSSKLYYLYSNGLYIFHDLINNCEMRYNSSGELIDSTHWLSISGNKWTESVFDNHGNLFAQIERNNSWQLDGYWMVYDKITRHLTSKSFYKNGKPEGIAYLYDSESGSLWMKRYFNSANEDSIAETFDDSGRLSTIYRFKNGIIHGNTQYFDENGKLKRITIYENGQAVETIEY